MDLRCPPLTWAMVDGHETDSWRASQTRIQQWREIVSLCEDDWTIVAEVQNHRLVMRLVRRTAPWYLTQSRTSESSSS